MKRTKGPLELKSFAFALKIIKLSRHLTATQKEFVLSKQLQRSGTSIGANIREAQNAQSKADFIHKLSIALKECDETMYWLELLEANNDISEVESTSIINDCTEIMKMLTAAVKTSRG